MKVTSTLAAGCAVFLTAAAFGAPTTLRAPTPTVALLESRTDSAGTTTYWGNGASYEIVKPGLTAFLVRQANGTLTPPLIRIVYVGDRWINLQTVTFTVGERSYGPYGDIYSNPTRIVAEESLRVEALLFSVDSEEKWRMVDAIAEAEDLGRPVIAVFEGEVAYGIELDRTSKRATGEVVRGFREAAPQLP